MMDSGDGDGISSFSSSSSSLSSSSSFDEPMNEIFWPGGGRGLWIGSIGALRRYKEHGTPKNCHWTIISLLDSDKIQKIAQALLLADGGDGDGCASTSQQQPQQEQQNNNNKNEERVKTRNQQTTSGPHLTRRIAWQLKDKSNSTLVCERLEEILAAIDAAVGGTTGSNHVASSTTTASTTSSDKDNDGDAAHIAHLPPNQDDDADEDDDDQSSSCLPQHDDDPPSHYSSACLVHCAQGISRSAAVCAAWLISRKGLSLQDALTCIRRVRPKIKPNLGFLADLRAIEQSNGDIQLAMRRMKRTSHKSLVDDK